MSTEIGQMPERSLFDKLIGRVQSPWITLGIALLLILVPLGAATLDGILGELFREGVWRGLFLAPAVIIYILAVSPIMTRAEAGVLSALRPVVQVDDERWDQLLDEATSVSPIGEGIACGAGAVFGVWLGRMWVMDADGFWLKLYLPLSAALMFGLLAWTIYVLVASTRLTTTLFRQPLRIDIFDTEPFEPVGRQSLVAALVFVGGIVLGMLFGLGADAIFAWQNWILIGFLAMVPVLVFFLSMRDTHRVLAAEKERELERVQKEILDSCRVLVEPTDEHQDTGSLADRINVLTTYEERVQAARTWPYDTAMLRTLFFSVIIPGAAALARGVSEVMFN